MDEATPAATRLATYGTLQPGRPNHHQLDGLTGRWLRGHVHGRLLPEGWGAAQGYPALVLDPDGEPVEVQVFDSPDLPRHWPRLDAFEGPGYRRTVVEVDTGEGVVEAYLYALRTDDGQEPPPRTDTTTLPGMLRCTPFLLFDGNCAEAMAFYQRCLGGELTVTLLGDTPMREQLPAEKHGRVVNAHLRSGALEISATDWMASPEFDPVPGNTYAVFVTGAYAELRPVFDQLKDGENNSRLQELHEMPFGVYGQFYDRYGVQWIFRGQD